MPPIRSRLRSSEPDRLTLLARGRTADVYAWGERYILKLFRSDRRDIVEYEARIARTVHQAGMGSPCAPRHPC